MINGWYTSSHCGRLRPPLLRWTERSALFIFDKLWKEEGFFMIKIAIDTGGTFTDYTSVGTMSQYICEKPHGS